MPDLDLPLLTGSSLERINLKIGAILTTEIAAQRALAENDPTQDENLYDAVVTMGAFTPWSYFETDAMAGVEVDGRKSIISVWLDSMEKNPNGSVTGDPQFWRGTFNVDCFAVAQVDANAGMERVDDLTSQSLYRTIRLVRGILMNPKYSKLDLDVVTERTLSKVEVFKPQETDTSVIKIIGARCSFVVEFDELLEAATAETLTELGITTSLTDGGVVILETITN